MKAIRIRQVGIYFKYLLECNKWNLYNTDCNLQSGIVLYRLGENAPNGYRTSSYMLP